LAAYEWPAGKLVNEEYMVGRADFLLFRSEKIGFVGKLAFKLPN
jgi:hypothetical protein